jgi:hypothetical protein
VNAERIIPRMIVRRHGTQSCKEKSKCIDIQHGDAEDSFSIRRAMKANRDVVIRNDRRTETSDATSKYFGDVVGELYTVLEGLTEYQEELENSPGLELIRDRASKLFGWEYMDVVKRKLHPRPRKTQLKSTCGKWPKLKRKIGAVVLFGVCFQDVIGPIADGQLCPVLQFLPKGKDHLAMEVCMLQDIYREDENEAAQVTLTGTYLRRSSHIFNSCQKVPKRNKEQSQVCKFERIQEIVWKKGGTRNT